MLIVMSINDKSILLLTNYQWFSQTFAILWVLFNCQLLHFIAILLNSIKFKASETWSNILSVLLSCNCSSRFTDCFKILVHKRIPLLQHLALTVAFTLQSYSTSLTRKDRLRCHRKSPTLRVVFPSQSLLHVWASGLCRQCKGEHKWEQDQCCLTI